MKQESALQEACAQYVKRFAYDSGVGFCIVALAIAAIVLGLAWFSPWLGFVHGRVLSLPWLCPWLVFAAGLA